MNCNPVIKGDDPEVSALELGDRDPEAPAIALLPLHPERMLYRANAPLLPQIGALPQNLVLKVRREVLGRHGSKIPA